MLAVCLAGVLGLTLPGEGSPRSPAAGDGRLGHRRIERLRYGVEAECEYGPQDVACGIGAAQPVKVKTPAVRQVDVVLTASLQYKTTSEDWGTLKAYYGRRAMSPGKFRLMSPSPLRSTSTTLTWVKKSLNAGGRSYSFSLSPNVRNGDDSARAAFTARKIVIVVEVWPSGP